MWPAVLTLCAFASVGSALLPDSTGLVGSTAPVPGKPMLPLRFWDNPRKSPLKPRRRDLHAATLLRALGNDFDPRWMRIATHHGHHSNFTGPMVEDERKAVRALRGLAESTAGLIEGLPDEYQTLVQAWLVRKATCPIRYVWDDLGPYFWPRWVRRGECDDHHHQQQETVDAQRRVMVINAGLNPEESSTMTSSSTTLRDPDYDPEEDAEEEFGTNMSYALHFTSSHHEQENQRQNRRSCSWPPGMRCMPGVAKNLQILRWHCRLRKNNKNNNVWSAEQIRKDQERRKKRRKKYRCLWLKVPYPVPEDCVCSC